jgi:hypothetical protein
MLNDSMIRSELRRLLIQRHAGQSRALIIEELGLRHGSSRLDLAVVNGSLNGYEIKSDRDTLRRLPKQILTYDAVLDRITLVVTERHLEHVLHRVPQFWGILVADQRSAGSVELQRVRSASPNPAIDPLSVARLLWREEALGILSTLGQERGLKSKPRDHLYRRLTEVLSLARLRKEVRHHFRHRSGWRVDGPPIPSGD